MSTNLTDITSIIFGNTSVTAVYYNSTLIWPANYTYVLRNLEVKYSTNDGAILANGSNYAYLEAELYGTRGSQHTSSTVTLTPDIQTSNDIYKISGTQITVNPNKKDVEYSQQHTQFSGHYAYNGTTYYVTSGTISASVIMQANVKTTVPATQTTTAVEAYLSQTDLNPRDSSTSVYITRTYNSTSQYYTYTSGYATTPDTSTGLIQTGVTPTSVTTNPTSNRTISGNVITPSENQTSSARTWNVYATYDNITSTNNCVLTQAAGYYTYSAVSVSIAYEVIDASGGTVTPLVTYSQTYGFNGRTSGVGTVTSGGTITYYVNSNLSSNGAVSANSLGTNRYTTQPEVAEDCYATVDLNGKSGESSHVSVYQSTNDIITNLTTAVVSVLFSGTAKTEYTFGPQSQEKSFSASSYRTYTWTSRAQSNETVGTSALTVTKSGSWFSVSNWKFTVNENTNNYERTGSITVKDSTYGSQKVDLTQEKVHYEFNEYSTNPVYLAYTATGFTITIESTRNWSAWSFTSSNITISNNTMSNLTCAGVAVSVLDPTLYVATFTCSANSGNSSKGATIKFKQPTSNKEVTYTVEQAAYIAGTISTSVSYIALGSSGSGSFTLTCNKNWSIETEFAMQDENGDSLGNDGAALVLSTAGGSAGTFTINVSRGSYTAGSFVDIKITCDQATAHVLVAPTYSISRSVSSWSAPADSSTRYNVISNTYPNLSWTSTQNWLSGSGTSISVSSNSDSSTRSGSIYATGSISGTWWGVPYDASANTDSISVTQAAAQATIGLYVGIDTQNPDTAYLYRTSNGASFAAPQGISVNDIQITDGQGHQTYNGYAIIQQGDRYGTIIWEEGLPADVGTIINSGECLWLAIPPSGYTLSINVVWE